jgi:predicted Rossmann fold nucleotide-binding protein DprA/Smf involved in DNA uptake
MRAHGFWEAAALCGSNDLWDEAAGTVADAAAAGWKPLAPGCAGYPARLHTVLGRLAPPLIWIKGRHPESGRLAAVVGSRRLRPAESRAAYEAGGLLARLGFGVISGGAAGSDCMGVLGAVSAGGFGAHFLPGSACRGSVRCSALLCESPWAPRFDRVAALRRNRWIYAASEAAVVISSRLGEGGSWHGAVAARREKLTRVLIHLASPPSEGNAALAKLGMETVEDEASLARALERPPAETQRPLPVETSGGIRS